MNRHISKLNQHACEQTVSQQQSAQQQSIEFATAEDVIRHDAARTALPPSLATRLQASIAREPKPTRSWWQRWLGQPG